MLTFLDRLKNSYLYRWWIW